MPSVSTREAAPRRKEGVPGMRSKAPPSSSELLPWMRAHPGHFTQGFQSTGAPGQSTALSIPALFKTSREVSCARTFCILSIAID